MASSLPLRIINSAAPVRICDFGGWTDTWFAEHGKVLNLAVSPWAEVQIHVFPNGGDQRILIHAENFDDEYERVLKKGITTHY
jgi:D-glycero-alpha-D-manno-heptose-7-phosphate kinase